MERRQELRQHKPPGSPLQPTRNVAQLNSHINLLIRVPEKITNFVFAHTNLTVAASIPRFLPLLIKYLREFGFNPRD
jgi:hypothetical protein